jgi:hypothetical protein
MRARTFGAVAVVAVPLVAKLLRDRAVARNRQRYAEVITGPASPS